MFSDKQKIARTLGHVQEERLNRTDEYWIFEFEY